MGEFLGSHGRYQAGLGEWRLSIALSLRPISTLFRLSTLTRRLLRSSSLQLRASTRLHVFAHTLVLLLVTFLVHTVLFFHAHTIPMGFFDHLQKGGAFSLQPQKNQIRKVVQTRPAPAKSAPNTPNSRSPRVQPSSGRSRKTHAARSVSSDPDVRPSKRLNTPTRVRKRPTPEQRLSSDDDASDSDASFEVRKRARTSASAEPDPERRVRSVKAFSEEGTRPFKMVHATDITSTEKPGSFKPAFGAEKAREILLQYPSASQKERYGHPLYHLSPIVLTGS